MNLVQREFERGPSGTPPESCVRNAIRGAQRRFRMALLATAIELARSSPVCHRSGSQRANGAPVYALDPHASGLRVVAGTTKGGQIGNRYGVKSSAASYRPGTGSGCRVQLRRPLHCGIGPDLTVRSGRRRVEWS